MFGAVLVWSSTAAERGSGHRGRAQRDRGPELAAIDGLIDLQSGEFNDTDQHVRRVSTPDLTCGSGSGSSQKRDEVRIELLGCITRNFLSLDGATTPEFLRGEILSRCRPQLPACSTVNQCDAAQIAKTAPPAVRLPSKSVSGARKAVAIRQPTRSRSQFTALKIWRSITAVLKVGNPAPEGRN